MANHWAIAIGINQYQFLQPLRYAQQDAQSLRDFLVEEAGFAAERCLLLTDTSPPLAERSTEPTRFNIQNWIDELCHQQLQPGDLLWCFFSGCGVCYDQQDYLMPLDGNPNDIPGTAIAMRSLLEQIAQAKARPVLVLLDMNRSQGLQAEEMIGVDTIDSASKLGLATVLACEPGEFSHEVATLRHGCFAAALLEGLRTGKCDTLAGLDRYLRDRLPELTEHYWQPAQHAVTVVAQPDQLEQAILPSAIAAGLGTSRVLAGESRWDEDAADPSAFNHNAAGTNGAAQLARSPHAALAALTQPQTPPVSSNVSSTIDAAPEAPETPEMEDEVFWRRAVLGGGVVVLCLLVGVFLRNLAAFTGQPTASPTLTTTSGAPGSPPPATTTASPAAIASPTSPVAISTPESSPAATSSPISPTPAVISTAPSPAATSSPAVIPTVESSPTPTVSPTAIAQTTTQTTAQANQALLDKARVTIRPNQASRFNQAIAQASQIKPGQPLYEQAQQDIERWSQVILDLAQGRANQGQLTEAITTARLVPKNNAQVYGQAQQAIAQWQQRSQQQQANQATLAEAQKLLRRGEASSYNRAINLLRRIPADQPGYAEAQQRIAEWSNVILGMAELRASRGNLVSAVQTAQLVPPNTPAYAAAQKAIATWNR